MMEASEQPSLKDAQLADGMGDAGHNQHSSNREVGVVPALARFSCRSHLVPCICVLLTR